MVALLRPLINLCLLRGGPQDLPFSPPATLASVIGLVALQLGFAHAQGLPESALLGRAAVTLVLVIGATRLLLDRRGLANRMMQTVLALAGTSMLFSLATLPIVRAMQPHLGNPDPSTHMFLLSLAALALLVWKLRVEAAIWRQALDIRAGAAMALTLGLVVAEFLLVVLLVPVPVPVPAPG